MTVVTRVLQRSERELLDATAVPYPIAKRMLELAEAGDVRAAVQINRNLFIHGYERLLRGAELMQNGGQAPTELPYLLDTMRNCTVNTFEYSDMPQEDEETRREFLGLARESGKKIEHILEAYKK